MTDIEQARAVLATWRNNRFDTPWEVDTNTPFSADLVGLFAPAQEEYVVKFDDDRQPDGAVANLIVGTAGNPDLLDAIDAALDMANYLDGTAYGVAEKLAAAILAADQRINA